MSAPASVATPLDARSLALRRNFLRIIRAGARGHIGSALSLIEIIRVLYDDVLAHRPHDPTWGHRDRFILSKGHGCAALYAVLVDHGYFPATELDRFCKRDGLLGGHPEYGRVPGIEASTGALGHGISIGIGHALAARMRGLAYRTFVVVGDGETQEGSTWEAALGAAKHGLDSLCVVVDYNKMQSSGFVAEVTPLEPLAEKWRAFGFAVREVDGHDVAALRATFAALPFHPGKPNLVVAHTTRGKGLPFAENNAAWHHRIGIPPEDLDAMAAAFAEAA